MSRPAWLGPVPTGARAELIVLRALVDISTAYAELGHPPPPQMWEGIGERLARLAILLPLELGVPR